jgi:hypothetical protein
VNAILLAAPASSTSSGMHSLGSNMASLIYTFLALAAAVIFLAVASHFKTESLLVHCSGRSEVLYSHVLIVMEAV